MADAGAVRTAFQYDTVPWKLVFCDMPLQKAGRGCPTGAAHVALADLPPAPEPGRIPAGADHMHVMQRFSGERDAREEEKWRSLMFSVARCDHGRLPQERCRGCRGTPQNMEGIRVGTARDGSPVVIPSVEDMKDIRKWVQRDD